MHRGGVRRLLVLGWAWKTCVGLNGLIVRVSCAVMVRGIGVGDGVTTPDNNNIAFEGHIADRPGYGMERTLRDGLDSE